MPGVDDVIDEFSGMITHDQAERLLSSNSVSTDNNSGDVTNAVDLLEFIKMKKKQPRPSGSDAFLVDIRDSIYRVFNPITYASKGTQAERRSVVLGSEGSTVRLSLHGKFSSFMDLGTFERGDTILVKNALLDVQNGELKDGHKTTMRKVSQSSFESVIDYSVLVEGMRNIDVIGKIVELSQIRHISSLSGSGDVAVTDCVLSDLHKTISVSLWESSALACEKLHANDFVKIEFCNTRMRNDRLEIYANNLSRVVASKGLASRLR